MAFDLKHIFEQMGPLALGIAGVLVLMAIAIIGVTIERVWTLSRSAKQSRLFVSELKPALEQWDINAVCEMATKHKASAVARLFNAIGKRYLAAHAGGGGGLTPAQLARNEAERATEAVSAELRRGLNVLASVGSVAPFVGLLGTVVGIIGAFDGIASKGSGGISSVMSGISEALIETAFGLMVAIPAVLLFNYLTARISRIEMALARSAGELLDNMENEDGRESGQWFKQAA